MMHSITNTVIVRKVKLVLIRFTVNREVLNEKQIRHYSFVKKTRKIVYISVYHRGGEGSNCW